MEIRDKVEAIVIIGIVIAISLVVGYELRGYSEGIGGTDSLDLNTMLEIEYAGGRCERLGLLSSGIYQIDEEGNIMQNDAGNNIVIPICIEVTQNEQ